MIAFIIALCVIVYSIHFHFTKYNNYWKDRNIPGPKPTFFFGNIKELALRRRHMGLIFKDIYDQYPNEKMVGIFRMRTPVLLVKDLEIIKHVLIKDFECFVDREPQFSHKALGANLVNGQGDIWRALRVRFTPLFTSGKLKNMMYIIVKCSQRLVDYVDEIVRHQPEQEVHGLLKKFTQENIAACAFGVHLDSYNELCATLDALERNLFVMGHRAELDMMYPGILKKLGLSIMPKQVDTFFSNLAKDIINQRNGEPTGINDFMDLLLALKKNKHIPLQNENYLEVTEHIIASQMFIFYMAGFQTNATTMSFMLYHLALDSKMQDKVVEEIEEVLRNHGKLTFEAISELKYMEQVFNETLRMHPIGDTVRRYATADYKVPGTDLTIRKGQLIIVPVNVVHWDPNNYPEPEKFDPERFSPENVRARHSCAFLPFGEGPRKCMGIRFAKLTTKICLAMLLSKFRVERSRHTPDTFEYESSRIVVYPFGGFPLKLVHRF